MGACGINADIVQLRNRGAKYSEIQKYLSEHHNVEMSQQNIRCRYIRYKDRAIDDDKIMALILQGKTVDEIGESLGITRYEISRLIENNEKEYTRRLTAILEHIDGMIEFRADKELIDEYLSNTAGKKLSSKRLNDIYSEALKFHENRYAKRNKKYYKGVARYNISIKNIIAE